MTDDTSITVTALDRTLEFSDRDDLAAHVEGLVGSRGGVFGPLELAAIRKLAELGNGATPPDVKRIARATGFHGPDRGDADQRRAETPFAGRIAELGEELEAREAEHEESRSELIALRDELRAADRKLSRSDLPRAERSRLEDDLRAKRRTLAELAEAEQRANRAATRARAALNAAKLAADRWLHDQEARYVLDGETVDKETLLRRLDR